MKMGSHSTKENVCGAFGHVIPFLTPPQCTETKSSTPRSYSFANLLCRPLHAGWPMCPDESDAGRSYILKRRVLKGDAGGGGAPHLESWRQTPLQPF